MEAAVRKIALDKLVLSPANARKTPPSPAEDAELKASIRTRGLKQNLVVHPAADDKGVHAVTAGGRRLKALQELAAEGVIPDDYKVPCLVETPEVALETSLMENTVRAGMHPADEFVAMAAVDRCRPTDRSRRQPLRRVGAARQAAPAARQGRARIARRVPGGRRHPRGVDGVHLGCRPRDPARRLAPGQGPALPRAHTVRRLLTQGAVPADSRLGAFVGLPAYEAAGGAIRSRPVQRRRGRLYG